jgi:hypothetical protein
MCQTLYGETCPCQGALSDGRVTKTIMRIFVEELLCQGMMGWIPVLECLFVRCACIPVAMSYHARPYMVLLSKAPLQRCLPGIGGPPSVTVGSLHCGGPRGGSTMGRQVVKSYMSTTAVMGKRIIMGHS